MATVVGLLLRVIQGFKIWMIPSGLTLWCA